MNQLPLELIGAALALAFLVLVGLRRWWAWPAYIASSLVYLPVFWESKLYYDALLQLFFVGMGVYGWRSWSLQGEVIEPVSWGAAKHGRVLAMWLTASALMRGHTHSWMPLLRSEAFWRQVLLCSGCLRTGGTGSQ
jgi:nicotinamide mononucleotide transporter